MCLGGWCPGNVWTAFFMACTVFWLETIRN
uniref:ATTOC64-V (ARABIDOPSIS THALIANA TRANSLOCON AT THE OUTER MEMBRANE OF CHLOROPLASTS 64-V) n=1 Tax=Arundo donax TaxID=35708 RepID=A0A0A9F8G5_ARUDO